MSLIKYTTAGESHGKGLIAVIEGLPAGIPVSAEIIGADLARRRLALGAGPRMGIESDAAEILSGVMEGRTTGAPVAVFIKNKDHENWAGREVPAFTRPRPGHADLAAAVKYGYGDFRLALERSSARETAARTAAGALARAMLAEFGIKVAGKVVSIGGASSPEEMEEAVAKARTDGDTLGGVIEVVATGVPCGLGSHVSADRRLDARLAAALVSVQAIKGVEFGDGFAFASMHGTAAHDAITLEDGVLKRTTNRAGGIEGGISNGCPVVVRCAMKPIPTTLAPQKTVDMSTGGAAETKYERSDVAPVARAVVVLEAMTAIVIADALAEKLGGDSIAEMKRRFAGLPGLSMEELKMQDAPHLFWND